MLTVESVRKIALALEEAVELPHFDLTSFRVRKRIFATMDAKKRRVCLMLSPTDQSVFVQYDPKAMYPVPNKWGQKGATYVDLKKVRKDIFMDALKVSYCTVAPRKLAMKYEPKIE